MAVRSLAFLSLGLLAAGCTQSTLEIASDAAMTPRDKKLLGKIPGYVAPGPHNPMGSRALYVYDGPKDTLYRIHGTNQPEYIGSAISSGCIRLTNEDAIDLFNRVKVGSPVVVLAPGS